MFRDVASRKFFLETTPRRGERVSLNNIHTRGHANIHYRRNFRSRETKDSLFLVYIFYAESALFYVGVWNFATFHDCLLLIPSVIPVIGSLDTEEREKNGYCVIFRTTMLSSSFHSFFVFFSIFMHVVQWGIYIYIYICLENCIYFPGVQIPCRCFPLEFGYKFLCPILHRWFVCR